MRYYQSTYEISPGIDAALREMNPWYWAAESEIMLSTGPFMLEGHEFQVRPMSVVTPFLVVCKATQLYFSVSEVLKCFHGLKTGLYPQGVLYLFPTSDEVTDFSSSRWTPLILDNPDTVAPYVTDTNRANLKRIGQGHIYFRGGRLGQTLRGDMKTSSKLKSFSADHCTHDEYDEMNPGIDEFVDGRLADSNNPSKSYIANPTLPDYGVDSKFQETNQEYWHIKCDHCSHYTCLDLPEYWPENGDGHELFHEQPDGSVIRACKKCHRELDPRKGTWVPARPDIKDKIGFTIGRPSAPKGQPAKLLETWRHPKTKRGDFIRLQLGRAFVEAQNRLSHQEVYDCCSTLGIPASDPGPCSMGVDQGGTNRDLLHIVIGKSHSDKKDQILSVLIELGWEELDRLMKVFNVIRCVVDGLPNQKAARAFAQRHPGKVYLAYFNQHQRGIYKWHEEDMTVVSNRTEAMDAAHDDIANGLLTIPKRCGIVDTFADHCHNVAKKLEEDELDGSKRYIWVKLGPDHFRLAQCYEAMARHNAPNLLFPGRA